jgi:hypothetical protein
MTDNGNPTTNGRLTEQQKKLLFTWGAIPPAEFERKLADAAKAKGDSLDDLCRQLIGRTWLELRDMMPIWRLAYINAEYAAIKTASESSRVETAPKPWRELFHLAAELQEGDVIEYIKGILPEGVTFLGALSGVGKTWFALSLAQALITGEKLFGIHEVLAPQNVLYLSPEVGDRALRKRLTKLRIVGNDRFRCQSVRDGVCALNDSCLESCVKEWQPIVFLDTAIRFNPAADENSSSQNAKLLARDILKLIQFGAKSVVCLHHSPKYKKKDNHMTLENVLRGTGDIGAMCDAVWGIEHDRQKSNKKDWDEEYEKESARLTRLYVECVKPRDFDPVEPFRIQGRPFVDRDGSFKVLVQEQQTPKDAVGELIASSRDESPTTLRKRLGMGYSRFMKLAEESSWKWNETMWERQAHPAAVPSNGATPF